MRPYRAKLSWSHYGRRSENRYHARFIHKRGVAGVTAQWDLNV